eukprot:9269837-Pyramimonas_sp.AAC.1
MMTTMALSTGGAQEKHCLRQQPAAQERELFGTGPWPTVLGRPSSRQDYCKSSGRHTVHAGGMTFIAGVSRALALLIVRSDDSV